MRLFDNVLLCVCQSSALLLLGRHTLSAMFPPCDITNGGQRETERATEEEWEAWVMAMGGLWENRSTVRVLNRWLMVPAPPSDQCYPPSQRTSRHPRDNICLSRTLAASQSWKCLHWCDWKCWCYRSAPRFCEIVPLAGSPVMRWEQKSSTCPQAITLANGWNISNGL